MFAPHFSATTQPSIAGLHQPCSRYCAPNAPARAIPNVYQIAMKGAAGSVQARA